MELSINNLNDSTSELTCTLSVEDLAPHFIDAYRKASSNIELKGYRKGKVPLVMVKRIFGDEIENKAVDEIANDIFKNGMMKRNITPIGTPVLTNIQFKRGTDLSFTVRYEIKPVVIAKEFRGTSVNVNIIEYNEAAYEKELMHRRRYFATHEEAQQADSENDVVTADTEELDEQGVVIPSHSRMDVRFTLSEPTLEKEVVNVLRSTPIGQTGEAVVQHTHGDHTHTVRLKITVKKIEHQLLPELDDAFAAKASYDRFTTIDAYTADLRTGLERYYTERNEKSVESELLQTIVAAYDFTVPNAMVEHVLDAYLEDVKSQQPSKELPRGFDVKQYHEMHRENAAWDTKWMLVREALLAKENIQISDEDLEKLAEEIGPKSGIDKERLIKYYKESGTISEKLLSDKLMKLIKDNAVITTHAIENEQA